jgi:lipoprotein-anchoring transpeptidase ErfK/SrfK
MKIHVALLIIIAAVLGPAVSGSALPPELIPTGVRVAGVDLGGKRPYQARRLVRARYEHPLKITFQGKIWPVSPLLLASSAAISHTVDRALHVAPGARLKLPVAVQHTWIKMYVDYLDQTFRRAPVSAKYLGLVGLKPAVRPARYGVRVAKRVMIERIERNLRAGRRIPIELALYPVKPKHLKKDFVRTEIVIRRLSNRLYLYRGATFWRSFGVATGSSYYPTPTGNFKVVDMQKWPWWYPPNSAWAAGASPIPPGPGNPLGTRWMGLDVSGVGMHGTPDDASIGYSASHGCIRMHIPDAEWLFDHITLGTPVHIVDA